MLNVEDRVKVLEKRNKLTLTFCGLLSLACIAGAAKQELAELLQAKTVRCGIIRAEAIMLVDSKGKTRGLWSVNEKTGEARLMLNGPDYSVNGIDLVAGAEDVMVSASYGDHQSVLVASDKTKASVSTLKNVKVTWSAP